MLLHKGLTRWNTVDLFPHWCKGIYGEVWWDQAVKTVRAVENGKATLVTRTGHHWVSSWHHFIDYLVEGKTAEDFFERVPCPRDQGG